MTNAAALPLVLVGASGRMGQAIARIAGESPALFTVIARASEGDDLTMIARGAAGRGAVAIDFSSPEGTRAFAPIAAEAKLPIVVGTTGLGDADRAALERAASAIPIFVASNMSVGVYVLGALVTQAATMLGDDFDVEIVEAHHKKKADAPSGTALTLLEAVRRGLEGEHPVVHGRSGRPGARPPREIAMHAVRGGDVVGDHSVHYLGEGERLELVHRATSRDVFARGALRAARFLAARAPGLYGMPDLFR